MCAFKAFDEYLKDVATATGRMLVVPDRYFFANLSATAFPWQRCLRARSPTHDPATVGRVVLRKHTEWAESQCIHHKYIRLTRCRSSGREGGCEGYPNGISNCTRGNVGVDRCLVLNGLVHLKGLLAAVPEFGSATVDCITITNLARGVVVSPTEGPPCTAARWNPLMWTNEWVARADDWLSAKGLRRPEGSAVGSSDLNASAPAQSLFVAAQFRTEKWPAAVAGSSVCWESVARALKAAATAQKVSTVFIATDALGSTSTTYSMKGGQKAQARKAFRGHLLGALRRDGLRVVMWEPGEEAGVTSDRAAMVHAAMDLLVCSRAKLFVHMYGTFGRDADALDGCKGARAGSCYGNWVVHTREFRGRPTAMLSAYAAPAEAATTGAEAPGDSDAANFQSKRRAT